MKCKISLAILNAGIYEPEEFGFDMSIARKTMHTNVLGTLNCLSEILKKFHNRQYGQIALMSSCAGYRGLPNAASYTASRATIINLAEALRFELEPKGIKIQVITKPKPR